MRLYKRELYLPRVQPRYASLAEVVARLGCRVVRDPDRVRGIEYGDPPMSVAAFTSGDIYVPTFYSLDSHDWAWVAHEAMHLYAGRWSLVDELGLLAYEVEVYRRVAKASDRAAALLVVANTTVNPDSVLPPWRPWDDVMGVVRKARGAWTRTPQWKYARELAREHGLDLSGRIDRNRKWDA